VLRVVRITGPVNQCEGHLVGAAEQRRRNFQC
jgi:hypothetical protein